MHPDLEAVIAADEEGRSRVALAEQRRDREIAAARAERDAVLSKRSAAEQKSLENELQAIVAEGDARLHELQERQARYLASLAEAGDRNFDEAVAQYRKIVCTPEER